MGKEACGVLVRTRAEGQRIDSPEGLHFIWEESRNVSLRNYVWAVKKGERIAGKRGLVGRN